MRGSGSKSFPPPPPPPPHALHLIFFVFLLLFSIKPISSALASDAPDPFPSALLKDVANAIASKEKWTAKDAIEGVRVTVTDVGKVKVGRSRVFEFDVRARRKVWRFRFLDDGVKWREVSGFREGLVSGSEDQRGVKAFELEGPLELQGGGDSDLSLRLPSNTTHVGLNKILVNEGIRIKIEGAKEVTVVFPCNMALNRSLVHVHKCPPLLSVYIQGTVAITAYRIHDFRDYIETKYHSPDAIELLSDICFDDNNFRFQPILSVGRFSSMLNIGEKILGSLLDKTTQDWPPQLIKAKIASSTMVKLRLELERKVEFDDIVWKEMAEWKTRPSVERAKFEVVARVKEEGKILKLVKFKKMKKPFVTVDTTSWSNLMSNVSFTKFSTVVVPPKPLTLDMKW